MLRALIGIAVLISFTAAAIAGSGSVSWITAQTETITLDQAIEMALTNNLDAEYERAGIGIARERVSYAWGVFDPTFASSATRESIDTPQNATNITSAAEAQQLQLQQQSLEAQQELVRQIAIANGLPPPTFSVIPTSGFSDVPPLIFESENFRVANQLQGKTPLGTTYAFSLQIARTAPNIAGIDREFVPLDTAQAAVTLQQPLLRDFGPAANLAEVRINRQNQKIATLSWEQSVMTAVQTVMNNYYDMVYALRTVQVREEAVVAGQHLVQGNQRRIDVGLMSPIDVRQAQVALSEEQESLLIAKNLFMERQFALKRAILRESQIDEPRVFVPAGAEPLAPPLLEAIEWKRTAFEKRLDYKSALQQTEIENIRLRFARNRLLPRLDLVGSYGLNGLTTNFGSSVNAAFSGQAPQWSAGVVASIPLGNVQARAQLNITKGLKEQSILRIKQTELTIDVDVDTIISRIRTNQQRVETARQSRRLGEEAMKIQNKRLEQGQVSSFDIIDTQRKLYDARTREIAAQAELDKSIVQLWFSTGTLLDEKHIVVDTREKPRNPPRP